MEEFANNIGKFLCFGLLGAVLFLASPEISAQEGTKFFTSADAALLLVEPKDDTIFTNHETQFVLQVIGVSSSDVQMELPKFPEGVAFVSSRRENIVLNGERATQIDLWFNFRTAGEFSFSPLVLVVQGRRYYVKFKTVQVYENPQTIQPRVVVNFDNGKTIFGGEKDIPQIALELGVSARFTIYLQYGVQLQQFAWTIPKDSIFKELARYEINQGNSRFSTERIPIAYFEWIPLEVGKTSLPEIRLMVTAYSGRAVYLTTPECMVNILPAKENSLTQSPAQNELVFENAFVNSSDNQGESEKQASNIFAFSNIAELRSAERRALLQGKIRTERIAAEAKMGIQNSQNEPSIPVFILFASVFAFFALAAIVLICLHKKSLAGFSAAIALVFAFFAVIFSSAVFERYCIVIGGSFSPVPEDSALTKTIAGEGSRVCIRQEIENWYFIEYNESSGWIKKENVVLIK